MGGKLAEIGKYREEVQEAVANQGPAWNAIRAWHESFERRTQTLETMKQGAQLIVGADMALVALVELGVRLGLGAAAKAVDLDLLPVGGERPGYVIRAIDPASVLKNS